jgi:flagellin
MALSVLNNIASLTAQNNLTVTNNNLNNTLLQLSSGSRINSGADDPAGLSIVNGLQANITALTQSAQNATDGVGQLQVADGALSQVTTLLNRAVTLATEAANGGLTPSQFSAITNEYGSILNEINRIGNATNFNGTAVFQAATLPNPNEVATTASSGVSQYASLTSGQGTTVKVGNASYTFTAGTTTSDTNDNQLVLTSAAQAPTTAIAGGVLVISGSTHTFTTSTSDSTIGALVNDINTNSAGHFSAFLDNNGKLNIVDNGGAGNLAITNGVTSDANNISQFGATAGASVGAAVTGTSTVQDLINGINGSGLGVTAGLATVANTNQLSGSATGLSSATTLSGTMTITAGANTFTYSSANNDPVLGGSADTVQGLIDSINSSNDGLRAYLDGSTGALQIVDTNGNGDIAATVTGNLGTAAKLGTAFSNPDVQQLTITDNQGRGTLSVTDTDASLGYVAAPGGNTAEGGNADSFVAPSMSGSGGAKVFISDGDVTNPEYNTINVQIGSLSTVNLGGTATTLQSQNLGTASGAASALTVINSAISDVAAMRGTIGAGINRLNSATNVINTQVQNLTSAQSSIQDANVGQVVANLSKYQILEQTGISALAQANQNQQAVLKLLQ